MSSELGDQAAFEGTPFGFLVRQFTRPKPLPDGAQLTNQVAIVTGSNVGLGLAACRQLLGLGLSHLIMGVRSQARGDAAAASLRAEFPEAKVSVWILDMEHYDSVAKFTARCAELPRIDVVILNAALMKTTYTTAPSTGYEVTLQVNYLSTVLLVILLLPILKSYKAASTSESTRPPVLSIIGSDLAYSVDMKSKGPVLQQFQNPQLYTQFLWYGRSKLLLTFFIAKLATFVDPEDVLINMPNPGSAKDTAFFREFSSITRRLWAMLQFLLARRVDVAASTYLDAFVGRGRETHGSFLSDWAIKPYPQMWYTPDGQEFGERLWEETLEELHLFKASKIIQDVKNSQSPFVI